MSKGRPSSTHMAAEAQALSAARPIMKEMRDNGSASHESGMPSCD